MSFTNDPAGLQNQLPLSVELSDDPKDLRFDVNDLYQSIASSVNNKIGGLYVPQEKINSEQYYNKANTQKFLQVYRMVVDFGDLPNTAAKSVAHNIPGWNSLFRLTASWGGTTDPVALSSLPIPNDGILLEINSTNVTVTTTSDLTAYTDTSIVIEYTKGV